jgi:hypothetical protein
MTPTPSSKGEKNIEEIIIVTPPVASTDIDLSLVKLTEYLTKKVFKGEWQGGGLLGGEFGYGVDYENDVFMMKPYCWCEREDCIWCMMNDPKENKNYKKQKAEIEKRFGKECADWGGAPQFYYKPSKLWIRWYKWIGRDMEYGRKLKRGEWKRLFNDCIKSIC